MLWIECSPLPLRILTSNRDNIYDDGREIQIQIKEQNLVKTNLKEELNLSLWHAILFYPEINPEINLRIPAFSSSMHAQICKRDIKIQRRYTILNNRLVFSIYNFYSSNYAQCILKQHKYCWKIDDKLEIFKRFKNQQQWAYMKVLMFYNYNRKLFNELLKSGVMVAFLKKSFCV